MLWFYGAISIAGSAYCIYAALPYSITFYPLEQRYEYTIGIRPLAWRKSGYYCELDSIFVNQSTTHEVSRDSDRWYTTYEICVMWATENRHVAIALANDITQAKHRAEELAEQASVPYGGIYDVWNKMWLVGPMHKKIGNEIRAADEAEKIADQLSAEHAPPAVGDETGFNESGMWK